MIRLSIYILLFGINSICTYSQEKTLPNVYLYKTNRLNGITIQTGFGKSGAIDYLYSNEKYSGTTQVINANWCKPHNKYLSNLDFSFQTSKLNEDEFQATLNEIKITQAYLYPFKGFNERHEKIQLFFGPTVNFNFLVWQQQFSQYYIISAHSFNGMVASGIKFVTSYTLMSKAYLTYSFNSNVFSIVSRMPDISNNEVRVIKLLPFYRANNLSNSISMYYQVYKSMHMGASYMFDYNYILPKKDWPKQYGWHAFKSSSDIFSLSIKWNFR